MTTSAKDFDVAVVSGSVAGCTAARLFAQRGASVAFPDGASEFPNEDGLTVFVAVYPRWRLTDLEGSYMRALTELPGGPDLSKAERVSKILGKIEVPTMATGSATANAAGPLTLTLSPNKKGKKFLGWKSPLNATVKITYTPAGGTASSITRNVKFKLVKKKR
jgi:hypothetical protein